MRVAAFLVPIAVLLLLASTANPAFLHQQQVAPGGLPEIAPQHPQRSGDTVRMWKHAEIRVVPAEVLFADQTELQSLRDRVARAEMESARLAPVDRSIRQQLSHQRHLMDALLAFAERQGSDRGKSPMALEVQNNLNRIEGQVMCETCHSRAVASNHAGAGSK